MSQTRIESLKETTSNTTLGFLIALAINVACVHLIEDKTIAAVTLTLTCTAASLLRGYGVRRYYNRRAQQTMSEADNTVAYAKAALKDYMTETTWSPELRSKVDEAIQEARDTMLILSERGGAASRTAVLAMGPGEIINGLQYLARSGRVPADKRADLLAIHDRAMSRAKAVLEAHK